MFYSMPFSQEGREQIKNKVSLFNEKWLSSRHAIYPTYFLGYFTPLMIESGIFNKGLTNNLVLDTLSVAFPVTLLMNEFYKTDKIYENPKNLFELCILEPVEDFFRKYF